MNNSVCKMCNGRKTLMGLGMMRHTCKNCDGEGTVKSITKEVEDAVLSVSKNVQVKTDQVANEAYESSNSSSSCSEKDTVLENKEDQVKKKRGRPPSIKVSY